MSLLADLEDGTLCRLRISDSDEDCTLEMFERLDGGDLNCMVLAGRITLQGLVDLLHAAGFRPIEYPPEEVAIVFAAMPRVSILDQTPPPRPVRASPSADTSHFAPRRSEP